MQSRLGQQIGLMLKALYHSPVGRTLVWLVVAIVGVVVLTAYGQIRLNSWNRPFYDAISRRDFRDFMFQLLVFALIAGGLLILNVAQKWLVETLKMRLREGLVQDLVSHWMLPRRAFWLSTAGAIGVNPDQRMHDDAHKLCDMSGDLGVGLLQATILFGTFASVLWTISADFSFRIGGNDYPVPGFMLWAAIVYAAAGSLMSYWVGRSLIGRNAERYAREAELRSSLTRINEHLDGISLASGEGDEKRRVERNLGEVITATARIVTGLTNLTWVTSGFGWTMNIAPTLVAAPLYFSGKISFGGLMMAAAAFTQAQSSLRWFVDNFSIIADWRATLLRVASFRQALTSTLERRDFDTRIDYAESEPGTIAIEGLEVLSSAGGDRLDAPHVVVKTGQRLLIVAAPGANKTLLFRALAGLWPWGAGQIRMPKEEAIHYMPRGTPYLPNGTLREVLSYPIGVEGFDQAVFEQSLKCLQLDRLIPMLDVTHRWDRELSLDEQQLLAFARVVLQAPPWVLMDEAFGVLDEDTLELVVKLFAGPLAHIGVIHIGRAGLARDRLFTQVVHLVKAADAGDSVEPERSK
jgi:putative ATP-binding cassette transporter